MKTLLDSNKREIIKIDAEAYKLLPELQKQIREEKDLNVTLIEVASIAIREAKQRRDRREQIRAQRRAARMAQA